MQKLCVSTSCKIVDVIHANFIAQVFNYFNSIIKNSALETRVFTELPLGVTVAG